MTGKNTLGWVAKYGAVIAVPTRGEARGSADGINERGLGGALLWSIEPDYGQYDPEAKSLSLALWLQYYLDNFATIREAVDTGIFDGRSASGPPRLRV